MTELVGYRAFSLHTAPEIPEKTAAVLRAHPEVENIQRYVDSRQGIFIVNPDPDSTYFQVREGLIHAQTHDISLDIGAHPWRLGVIHSDEANEIRVLADRYFIRPFFYFYTPAAVYYSTNFAMLAWIVPDVTPDSLGILSLLCLGRTTGRRTLCKNITRHVGKSPLRFTDAGVTWENAPPVPALDLNPGPVSEVFSGILNRRCRVKHAISIPLSGGVDSRTIISAVPRDGISAYTRGSTDCMEVSIASRVADALKISHRAYPYPEDYPAPYIRQIISITGGLAAWTDSHAIHPLKILRQSGIRTVIPGTGGEICRRFWKVGGANRTDTAETIGKQLFNKENFLLRHGYESVLIPDAVQQMEALQTEYLSQYRQAVAQSITSDPLEWNDTFYLEERVRNYIIYGPVVWNRFMAVELPFLESEYLDTVRRLQPEFRTAAFIHRKILERHAPQLMKIPLAPSGMLLFPNFANKLQWKTMRELRKILRKSTSVSPQQYRLWIRNQKGFFTGLITRANPETDALVSKTVLKRIWDAHNRRADHWKLLGRIFTLLLFREYLSQRPAG